MVLRNEDSSARSVSPSCNYLRYLDLKVECCYPILVCTVCAKDCVGQLGLMRSTIGKSKC